MAISVSPSLFRNETYQPHTPRVRTPDELEQLKKDPTKTTFKGDIYHASNASLKKLSLKELQYETFQVDTSNYEHTTYSNGNTEKTKRIVAIRNPNGNGEILTFELSQKTIDNLKEKFDRSNNFFERGDGVLRLNGEAENFVTGWMQDIRENRNYDKADADGNGRIEGLEAQALTIGFERHRDYDYIGEKLVQVNAGMGGDAYQSLGRTPDAHHLFKTDDENAKDKAQGYTYKRSASVSQYTSFENTIEKELDHTLQMDANLDGIVTLDEGLRDEFGPDYRQKVIGETQEFHDDLLEEHPDLNDNSLLQNYNIGLNAIITEKEENTMKEAFVKQTLVGKQLEQYLYFLSTPTSIDMLDAKDHTTPNITNTNMNTYV